jgi:quercetin dioxygenase-like cupin family protein
MVLLRRFACGVLLTGSALAQDIVQVSPATAKVEYEDANIRVIRSHFEPGASAPMHSHPPRIVIALKTGTLRLSKPDGSSIVPPADPQQRPLAFGPQTHAVANIGNTPVENIEIELKRQPQLGELRKTPRESSADPDSLLHEPHHRWVMEAPGFRVVDARIPPGASTEWHRHRYAHVSVRVQGSRISSQKQGEEWTAAEDLPSGAVAFTRVAAPFVHRVKNSGNVEYRVVLVELLDDAAGAEPPTTEDRSKSN